MNRFTTTEQIREHGCCSEASKDGYHCTREKGHPGWHFAEGLNGKHCASWSPNQAISGFEQKCPICGGLYTPCEITHLGIEPICIGCYVWSIEVR